MKRLFVLPLFYCSVACASQSPQKTEFQSSIGRATIVASEMQKLLTLCEAKHLDIDKNSLEFFVRNVALSRLTEEEYNASLEKVKQVHAMIESDWSGSEKGSVNRVY